MSWVDAQHAALGVKQTPLKAGYRSDPSSALVTLKSSGTLDSHSITCNLNSPNAHTIRAAHQKVAGLHAMAGGPDAAVSGELCSGDMLLEALVGCAGVTLKAVATALKVPIESGEVHAEGDLDWRGTLGVDPLAPVGLTAIRLRFDLEMAAGAEVSEATMQLLGTMTERYCVVLQTIARKPQVSVRVKGMGETEDGEERMASWTGQV